MIQERDDTNTENEGRLIPGFILTLHPDNKTPFEGTKKELEFIQNTMAGFIINYNVEYWVLQMEKNKDENYHYHYLVKFKTRQREGMLKKLKKYSFEKLNDYLSQDQLEWTSGKGCYNVSILRAPISGAIGYLYKERDVHEPIQVGLIAEQINVGISKYIKILGRKKESNEEKKITKKTMLKEIREFMISKSCRVYDKTHLVNNCPKAHANFELELVRAKDCYYIDLFERELEKKCNNLSRYTINPRYIEYTNYYLDIIDWKAIPKTEMILKCDEYMKEIPLYSRNEELAEELDADNELKDYFKILEYNQIDKEYWRSEMNKVISCVDPHYLHTLWVHGPPGNGKSTLLKFIEVIFKSDIRYIAKDGYFTGGSIAKDEKLFGKEINPYTIDGTLMKIITEGGETNSTALKGRNTVAITPKTMVIGDTNCNLAEQMLYYTARYKQISKQIDEELSQGIVNCDSLIKSKNALEEWIGIFRRINLIEAKGMTIPKDVKDIDLKIHIEENSDKIFRWVKEVKGPIDFGANKVLKLF